MNAAFLIIGAVFFQLLALGYAMWFGVQDDDVANGDRAAFAAITAAAQ